ncbi:MAG: helix-turn-helix domain-containing protein [bacterium]|nr:helix-turn-helix domain-containing protein [bacterium]
MKYWNSRRIRREKEGRERRVVSAYAKSLEREMRKRAYTKGDARKNARLMFDALGSSLHRRMLARLRAGGAMSVTHLARPFGVMLPDAMRHVHILERAGLITTEKRGRIRFCLYNPAAPRELSAWLATRQPFDLD